VYRFVFIEQLENDEVILDARDRNFFVKLNSLGGFWGGSRNDISHRFIKGSWFNQINGNLNQVNHCFVKPKRKFETQK